MSKPMLEQIARIKKELDEMLALMLDKKDHTDVAVPIFEANASISKAEVLLMMKNLSVEQLKQLGIKEPIA